MDRAPAGLMASNKRAGPPNQRFPRSRWVGWTLPLMLSFRVQAAIRSDATRVPAEDLPENRRGVKAALSASVLSASCRKKDRIAWRGVGRS